MKILDVPQSGSVGAVTSSRNRFGQYRRQRATPVQPNTSAQQTVKANLGECSIAWRGLSDAERLAWDNYATLHPVQDALGQQVILTGHQMFNAVNGYRLTAGEAIQDAVPDDTYIGAPDFQVGTGTAAGLSLRIHTAVPVAQKIVVWASPPVSAGRKFNGDFRVVNVAAGSNQADQVVLTAAQLTAKFGTLAAGQKFFFKAELSQDGNRSTATPVSAVLT